MKIKKTLRRILRMIKRLPRKIRIALRYLKNNGIACTVDQIYLNLFDKSSPAKGLKYGVTRKKERRQPQLIVSLTSFPGRINVVDQGIVSLLSQTLKPDMLILWLAESQFPNRDNDLPKALLRLKKYGLQIRYCEDIRSYKKLIPALRLYPNDIIATADDDNIYDKKWLELLYKSYLNQPQNVQCHRVTKFIYDKNTDSFSIVKGGLDFYKEASFLNKLVGLGGVLYPPGIFYKDILDSELFMKLAPTNDDIWFWFMAALNNAKVNVVPSNISRANYIKGTQEGPCLTKINDAGENLFWEQFNNLLSYYPQLKARLTED